MTPTFWLAPQAPRFPLLNYGLFVILSRPKIQSHPLVRINISISTGSVEVMHLEAAAAALHRTLPPSRQFDPLKISNSFSIILLFSAFMMTGKSMTLEKVLKVLWLAWQCKRKSPVICRLILNGKKIFQEKKNLKLKHIYLPVFICVSVFWDIFSEQEEGLETDLWLSFIFILPAELRGSWY